MMAEDEQAAPRTTASSLSQAHRDLLDELDVTLEQGLTSSQASARRLLSGPNTVDPPIQCPAWICCLLPCIKSIPSQKAFLRMRPEDAEVKRSGRWVRYDASSLVRSDIVRLEEGDRVPADCTVLFVENAGSTSSEPQLFLVDHGPVTGDEKPAAHERLYWGGRVVVGSCVAVVTAVGNETRVGQLIRRGRFPVSGGGGGSEEEEEDGIALLSVGDSDGKQTDSIV